MDPSEKRWPAFGKRGTDWSDSRPQTTRDAGWIGTRVRIRHPDPDEIRNHFTDNDSIVIHRLPELCLGFQNYSASRESLRDESGSNQPLTSCTSLDGFGK